MNTKFYVRGLVGCMLLALLSCSEKEEVKPDPAGAAGATTLGTDASTPKAWACPEGVAGSKLVLIPMPDGSAYCIDEREAVYAEYKQFLGAKGDDLSGQPLECENNLSFVPRLDEEEPPYEYADCAPEQWLIDSAPDRAVNCVDFCDAWAFCDWAGKRLCGLRGADPSKVSRVSEADVMDLARSTESEWFNVCTQGGTTKYPHGDAYEPGVCLDEVKVQAEGDQALAVRDTSGNECRGQSAPYNDVYNMSGSVQQWANICRGSCYTYGGTGLERANACDSENLGRPSMGTANVHFGIRCCADAVPVPASR